MATVDPALPCDTPTAEVCGVRAVPDRPGDTGRWLAVLGRRRTGRGVGGPPPCALALAP